MEIVWETSELGMIGAYWTGGEPLVEYNKLIELMNYSMDRGLKSTIVTNGGFIGAFGNYKTLNKNLLKSAGLLNNTGEEIVETLIKSELERIYFSIDSKSE